MIVIAVVLYLSVQKWHLAKNALLLGLLLEEVKLLPGLFELAEKGNC